MNNLEQMSIEELEELREETKAKVTQLHNTQMAIKISRVHGA